MGSLRLHILHTLVIQFNLLEKGLLPAIRRQRPDAAPGANAWLRASACRYLAQFCHPAASLYTYAAWVYRCELFRF